MVDDTSQTSLHTIKLMPLASSRLAGLCSPSDAMAVRGGASFNPMSSDKNSA